MFYTYGLSAVAAGLLLALPASADGIYTKSSPVLQVDAKSYDKLIARSNHTSVCLHSFSALRVTDSLSDSGVSLANPLRK